MSDIPVRHVERNIEVDASASVVFGLVENAGRWPQFLDSVIHTETRSTGPDTDEVSVWALRSENELVDWTAERRLDREALEITFSHKQESQDEAAAGGVWRVVELAEGRVELSVGHWFRGSPSDATGDLIAQIGRRSEDQLRQFKSAAERAEELEQLVVEFDDSLFIAGAVEDAYQLLYRAQDWPSRFPHVTALALEEGTPGIQFFDMDTLTPDGRAHTTRSVRVCFPHHKIIYKQVTLAPLLEAHTGHWLFTETPEGLIATARHRATIKADALYLLGAGTTVLDARRYLRKALSTNSVSNLRFAKEYAEERHG